MALLNINYLSRALNMQIDVEVIIPESWQSPLSKGICDHKYPVLWLLHGGGGDHTDWQRFTSIERYANKAGIAVVMPGVDNSGYMNMKHGGYRYWDYISEDLPSFLRNILPLSDKREDNFVAGLSMGGYGALKLALNKPEMFAAAASLSGGLDMVNILKKSESGEGLNMASISWGYGSSKELEGTESDNAYMYEKRIREGCDLPKLYFAIGTEDFGYEGHTEFLNHMRELGAEFTYEEGPGTHSWDFWDCYIQKVIDWLPIQKKN